MLILEALLRKLNFSLKETPHSSGWAETPKTDRIDDETSKSVPTASTSSTKKRSRWDETPIGSSIQQTSQMTPNIATANGTPSYPDITPSANTPTGIKAMNLNTPLPNQIPMTPEQIQAYRWEREIDERNRPFTDEELDSMFPPGYKVCIYAFLYTYVNKFYFHNSNIFSIFLMMNILANLFII